MTPPLIVGFSIAGIILIAFTVFSIITNIFLSTVLVPSSSGWKKRKFGDDEAKQNASKDEKEIYVKMGAMKKEADHWTGNTPHQEIWVNSFDNLRLHGFLFPVNGSHNYAIIIHGYRGRIRNSGLYGIKYFEKGYNVLLPENRATGMSEGKFLTMGALEKKDVKKWIDRILEIDKEANIVLHGESMGAATIMMALGDSLPKNVKAAIADCGYTSVWDEFSHCLKNWMHKPIFPLLHLGSMYSRLRFGFGFKKTSCLKALAKSKTPILIIHGGKDNFIPTKMAKLNYVAAKSEKDWFIMPNAGHCMSVIVAPEVYWAKVWEFFSRLEK